MINQIYEQFIENDNIKIDKIFKNLIRLYSKKLKVMKLKYFNQWRYKILNLNLKLNQIKNNKIHLRLYEDYKKRESYLETLKIIYQLKEGENYSFQPLINNNYNLLYDKKYNDKFQNDNYLTKYNKKKIYNENKKKQFYKNDKKKNLLNLKSLKEKKKNTKKKTLSIPINNDFISKDNNENILRRNSFLNTIYLTQINFSPENSSLKISLPNSKKSKSRNKINKKNNLLFPSKNRLNVTETENQSKTKTKFSSEINSFSKSFIHENLIIQTLKKKNKKNLKLPNLNYLLTENNDNYVYNKLNDYSNDKKDLNTAENSKLKSNESNLSKTQKNKKNFSLRRNLENNLNENDNYSIVNNNNFSYKGIKKNQSSSIISLQSITDEKLLNQAKLFLTKDNSLDNFIILKTKK